jgi:hypothetical protein
MHQFGEVINGRLSLDGNIVPGKLRFERSENGDIDLAQYAIKFDLDDYEDTQVTVTFPFFADYRLGEVSKEGFPAWLEDDTIYCLFLWSNVGFKQPVKHKAGRMLAIIAEKLNSTVEIYRRVGFADLHFSNTSSTAHYEILLRCSISEVDNVTVI